jgi:quinoprotein glucose dehydrogenase
MHTALLLAGLAQALPAPAPAAKINVGDDKDFAPHVAPASGEGKAAMARMQLKKDFAISLFAAEPRLANPVSFAVDYRNNFFVAETFRHHRGVDDIREHMDWCDDDLASRTVEDRVALLQKHLKKQFADHGKATDRVRWLRDTDGDGVADVDRVFADGFQEPSAGIGSGVLAWKGNVYYTCIPKLWLLKDTHGDGVADERRVLHHGFGVHIAMLGHDLHGLRIGPDRRLYFSCGDRALNVETPEGRVENHDTGAVLRCNLDGSGLEIFARGLRNPQELAFNEFGDLFTGDNNSDGGDRARFVYVEEGSDSGWRYGYQWLGDPHLRGPWNEEKLWHPHFDGQAAYVLPPIQWFANGPSGLTYYPGTGLGPEYKNHFFLCEFEGDPAWSGVLTLTLKNRGAGYEIATSDRFIWNALATDVDFGTDGSIYFTDWVSGWDMTGKGRIYRVTHASTEKDPVVAETKKLLFDGMEQRPVGELTRLLSHPDQRVRQEAHFELADRGAEGLGALAAVARDAGSVLSRLHALWGLEIAARERHAEVSAVVLELLNDRDPEVRAHAARACGALRLQQGTNRCIELLKDESPRCRRDAALALWKLRANGAVPALLELLRETGESDPPLRHAAILGLAGCASEADLLQTQNHASVDVRVGAVVALRRRNDSAAAAFLTDSEPRVATEAARAIYDVPIDGGFGALAASLADPARKDSAFLRRALGAALRLGGADQARRMAQFAARPDVAESLRVEALSHLKQWTSPPPRDAVTGEWRPIVREKSSEQLEAAAVAALAREELVKEIEKAPESYILEWMQIARKYQLHEETPRIARWLLDAKTTPRVRGDAMRALVELKPDDLPSLLRNALSDTALDVRIAALENIRKVIPGDALAAARAALAQGSAPELRAAFDILSKSNEAEAEALLASWVERLDAGLAPAEAALELSQAAEAKWKEDAARRMPRRRAAADMDPLVTPWLDCLYGGDAARGRGIFRNNNSLSCIRCHKTNDEDAGVVGPDLRGLSTRATRLQILESIVDPNRKITNGYHSIVFELQNGSVVAGRVESEDANTVRIRRADNTVEEVRAAAIRERRPDVSAMPEALGKFLRREEMRDLVEYLSGLK